MHDRLAMSIASKPNASSILDYKTFIQPAETSHSDTLIDGRSDHGSIRVSAQELRYVGGY